MREVAATTREAAARAAATNPTPEKRSRTLFFNPASGEPSVFHLFLSSLHPVIHAPFDPPIHRGSSRSLWADPHTGRNRSVPFFGRRTPALGRQQRGGFQNPLRRPVQNAQMLHTAYGASRSDLSRETPAARALRLAGRRAGRVVRRGHRRLDRRDHALRSRYAGRRLRRQSAPQQLGPTVRPPGAGTSRKRLGARGPETRKYSAGRERHAPSGGFRCDVSSRLRRREKSRTGHGSLPAPRTHGGGFRRVDRRLLHRHDLHDPARAGARARTARPATTGERDCCSRPGKSSGTAVRPTQNASHCSKRRAMPSAIASPGCSNPR